ncbi:transmembrane protein 120 homolog [Aethina tumida]|uniref:transmembrane protein 120 homolog n=1 Tax=Aethina tumida TaxID=116153 RepID=UPI002148504C|nr:transmembrane protein 120 homolog [Aethina tumida]
MQRTPQSMVESLNDEWAELNVDYRNLLNDAKKHIQRLEDVAEAEKQYRERMSHHRFRLTAMSKYLDEVLKIIEETDELKDLRANIEKRRQQLIDIELTLPRKNCCYLRAMLGNVSVFCLNKERQFRFKQEYEQFKLIANIVGFVVSLGNYFVICRPLETLFIIVLLWYFLSLTIRESILKVNGSKIKLWWQLHHFFAISACCVLLMWPRSKTWSLFRDHLMLFGSYMSLTQYMTYQAQRGALYRLRILGKCNYLTVTVEGFQSWMWQGLTFLLPFLFLGYVFQLYITYNLYMIYKDRKNTCTWHVPVLGIIFLIMSLGNTYTTSKVVLCKLYKEFFIEEIVVEIDRIKKD